jgi:hypothetical protein
MDSDKLDIAPSHKSEIVNIKIPIESKTAEELASACMEMTNPITMSNHYEIVQWSIALLHNHDSKEHGKDNT